MSRYETLQAEFSKLKTRQSFAVMTPTAIMALLLSQTTNAGGAKFLTGLAAFILFPFFFHRVWRLIFPVYRVWSDRSSHIRAEINVLQRRIAAVFEKYRERRKGEPFKQAYNLAGCSIRELEEALSIGMYRERREVFVTAFMRNGVAVRVTASIGSLYRCSAADNPARWSDHVERLGCDEIRQYHNHPEHNGSTRPSSTDVKTSGALRVLLGSHKAKLRSLVICWNSLREWKVFEYDEAGRYSLHFEFDAAV